MIKTTEVLVEKFIESVSTITEDTEVSELINIMKNEKTTFVPVVDKDGKLIGCVFDYNLIKLIKRESISPLAGSVWSDSIEKSDKKKKVREIMDTKVVTILPADIIDSALKVMNNNNARVMIVTDKDEKFIGVLRIRTIFDKLLSETE